MLGPSSEGFLIYMSNIIEWMLLDSVSCVSSPLFSSGYSNHTVKPFKVQRVKNTTENKQNSKTRFLFTLKHA
jgi:hypothetical protein